jgi:lysylphosphatidylglycerol synthetase-like protein (DUF2156 family)
MTPFTELLQQGTTHAWLFVPSAVLLGALHGLEPGHSKTMMAAFIIAIQGTVLQAVLLGLSATLSHTAVVWAIAVGGQYFGQQGGTKPVSRISSSLRPSLSAASHSGWLGGRGASSMQNTITARKCSTSLHVTLC